MGVPGSCRNDLIAEYAISIALSNIRLLSKADGL